MSSTTYRKEIQPYMSQSWLVEVPPDAIPSAVASMKRPPSRMWVSNRYMAQLYEQGDVPRLTVSRVQEQASGAWADRIPWDDLQACKREAGFGDAWAVEVYPPDSEAVTSCNMRHLWLLEQPPPYAWIRRGSCDE